MNAAATNSSLQNRVRWRVSSVALILLAWTILQFGCMFSPGLLDDVDSVYIEIAREMLVRHEFVTPMIDGVRFFDKPPLMYWAAAGSMRIFGVHDWAARLPLALAVLALLFSVYALGNRLFAAVSPRHAPDRAGLYAALITATSIGPYLYTRFYIPDIVVALWMALAVHFFLIALDRAAEFRSTLVPMLGFGAVVALNVLTKGFIGLVFPVGFALLYLAFTKQLRLLFCKLNLLASTVIFLVIAAPWHILAALRNPPVPMPADVGLPARAGWAWFYLYNEHVARFLGKRIPHDYGQVPIPLFWLLLFIWLIPWAAFLPAAIKDAVVALRRSRTDAALRFDSDISFGVGSIDLAHPDRSHEAALSLLLWAGIILGFFTLSSRQEYYHLPALPALALLVAGLLASADRYLTTYSSRTAPERLPALFGDRSATLAESLAAARWFLMPLGALLFLICGWFALSSPTPAHGETLYSALTRNPADYDLSLGHIFDLTGRAMGFFRGPLWTVALAMLALGPIAFFIRRRGQTFASNLLVAAAMTAVLLAVHTAYARFNPILGSKGLALDIRHAWQPGDVIAIDGELTSGSTLLFYTEQPVLLVNGRVNGPWFGSFFPDAPHIFLDDHQLDALWHGPHRVFLLTYHPQKRAANLTPFGPVETFASAGGKTVLTN